MKRAPILIDTTKYEHANKNIISLSKCAYSLPTVPVRTEVTESGL